MEIKCCPFCGEKSYLKKIDCGDKGTVVTCTNKKCILSGFEKWLADNGFIQCDNVDLQVLSDIYHAMDDEDKYPELMNEGET